MNLEDIMLSEIKPDTEGQILYDFSCMKSSQTHRRREQNGGTRAFFSSGYTVFAIQD